MELASAYIKFGPISNVKTVMMIHNIAFKSFFSTEVFGELYLLPEAFGVGSVKYYGGVSFLTAEVKCADFVTTISPNYANEICTPEFCMGLKGLLNGQAELGSGEAYLEDGFRLEGAMHPGKVSIANVYNKALSHLMQGGRCHCNSVAVRAARADPAIRTALWLCACDGPDWRARRYCYRR
ncbi:MAG: glycogen/starch synthase [Candidatus Devosia symbiotica]|nr:glycogen/starch synthase [Candidatus Devosia symbiotica]